MPLDLTHARYAPDICRHAAMFILCKAQQLGNVEREALLSRLHVQRVSYIHPELACLVLSLDTNQMANHWTLEFSRSHETCPLKEDGAGRAL